MRSSLAINRIPPSFTPSLSLSLLLFLFPSSSHPHSPSTPLSFNSPPPSSHSPSSSSSHPLLMPSSSFLRLLLPTTPSSSSFLKKFSQIPHPAKSSTPRLYSNAFEYWEQEFKGLEEIQVAIGRKDLLFNWEEIEGAYQLIFQLPPKIEEVLKSYAGFLMTEGEWEEEAEIKIEVMGEGGRREKKEEGERKEAEEEGERKEEEEEEEGGKKEKEERRRRETKKWLSKFLGAFKLQVEMKGLKGILRAYKRYKVKLDRWRIKSWEFGLLGMINGGKINIELEPRQLLEETEDEKSEKEQGKMEEKERKMEEEVGKGKEKGGERRKEDKEEEGWEEELIKNLVEVLQIDESNEMEVELMKIVEEMEWSELEVNLKGVLRLEAKMKRD